MPLIIRKMSFCRSCCRLADKKELHRPIQRSLPSTAPLRMIQHPEPLGNFCCTTPLTSWSLAYYTICRTRLLGRKPNHRNLWYIGACITFLMDLDCVEEVFLLHPTYTRQKPLHVCIGIDSDS